MKDLLNNLAEIARRNLLEHGSLTPCIMFFKEGHMLVTPQMMVDFPDCNAEESKTRNAWGSGVMAKKVGADFLVFIWDGAFRTVPNPDSFEYDETEAPLAYPKSLRTECIILNGIYLPSGKEDMVMVPYKGGDGEPVEFIPNELPEGAEFKSRFAELAVDGWNKSDSIIKEI